MAKDETDEVEEKAPKASKKKPVAKGKKVSTEKKVGASRKYDEDAKITILEKENPHREGTNRHEQFKSVLKAKTMADVYKVGIPLRYIESWKEAKLIKVG